MYSYEARIRAVELHIKLGKRVAETIYQLGYPTENAHKSWHRACEQRPDPGLPIDTVHYPRTHLCDTNKEALCFQSTGPGTEPNNVRNLDTRATDPSRF